MAAHSSSSILPEEKLSCPISFEIFNFDEKGKHPKLLLCIHTFCSRYLETLLKKDGTLLCPICHSSHIIPRVTGLLENDAIFEHLRSNQEEDDEALAMQLRDEYDVALRSLEQQKESDFIDFTKEETAKMRIEFERKKQELKILKGKMVTRRNVRKGLSEEKKIKKKKIKLSKCEDPRPIRINSFDDSSKDSSDNEVENVTLGNAAKCYNKKFYRRKNCDSRLVSTIISGTDGESSEDSKFQMLNHNEDEIPFHDVDETQTEDQEAMIHIRS